MNASDPNDAGPPGSAEQPTQGVRTTVSLLLFLHLAVLAVGVASNTLPLSGLRNKLGDVPVRPYLAALNMDLGYNYHLTPDFERDANDPFVLYHYIEDVEVELDWQGQTNPEARRTVLPAADTWPGIRHRRYRNLARFIGGQIGDEDFEGVLPYAVAVSLLAEQGVAEGTHRIRSRRQFLVEREGAGSIDPAGSDPSHPSRFTTAYEANLVFFQGTLSLIKAVDAGQAAPVRKGP